MSLRTLFIAGQFPPPVTGFAYITQEMAKLVSTSFDVKIIDLSPHRKRGGVSYHAYRLWLTVKGMFTLIGIKANPRPLFYVACESKLGLIYTILLCATARMFSYKTFVHHHNFNYIDNSSYPIKILLWVLSQDTTHIFLCDKMARDFMTCYNMTVKFEILSNSGFVNPPSLTIAKMKESGDPIVIGFLSNLNNAKGLNIFLSLLQRTAETSLNVTGILAGPADTKLDYAAIDSARNVLGERLQYLGPLYGSAKETFFNSIDVFVFPTRYANEAQPTVIYEAMSYGIPVLSYDRGCILSQVGTCGAVLGRDDDFVPFALSCLKEYISSTEVLAALRVETQIAFLEDHKNSHDKSTHIFETA